MPLASPRSRFLPACEAYLSLLVLEIVTLALAAGMVVRVAAKPPILRDFVTYLPASLLAPVACLAPAVAAVWAVTRWPWLLHAFAFGAAVLLLVAWIRARPSYGLKRGWPPGSLGVAASFDAIGDRHYYRDQAEAYGPVFKTSQFGRPVVCITGLRLGRAVLGETEALAGATLPYNRFVPKGSLRYMEDSVHEAEAPLFRVALSGLDLARHEERARETLQAMLSRLSGESLEHPDGVSPREYLARWAFTILASVFWDMAPDDARLPELDHAQRALDVGRGGGLRWHAAMERGFETVNRMMRERSQTLELASPLAERRCALAAVLAADREALDDPSRARNLALIARLASTDLTSLLDWILAQLASHAEWQEVVRQTPRESRAQKTQADDVASRVVYETLRLEQSEYLYREVTRPFSVGGYRVPAGWLVRVCVQESHRDPEIFSNPNHFDPDRFVGPPKRRWEYAPFGVDDHGCMGVPIVHFLGRLFVEELCHGYDTRVTRDAPLEKGTRHRDHWRPSSQRRVRLAPANAGGA